MYDRRFSYAGDRQQSLVIFYHVPEELERYLAYGTALVYFWWIKRNLRSWKNWKNILELRLLIYLVILNVFLMTR